LTKTLTQPARRPESALCLPRRIHACLFDLDGVLTDTARVHAEAWKQTFESCLQVPFDAVGDYNKYVDGKSRVDGVRSLLAARGIDLDDRDVVAIADLKNDLALSLMRRDGVRAFESSVRFVRAARTAGLACAVVSGSANCRAVLEAAGIAELFDARVDGVVAEQEHLRGKPAPDTYLAAARRLGVTPAEAAVFEDALAGVAAGRAGGFGLVVGVDRAGQADALRQQGADVVVTDLAELMRG
jgi:beta-phosphoglucomutase family hydrolase